MTQWPHGPVHRLGEPGAFMVTAGTRGKAHYFGAPDRLELLNDAMISFAGQYALSLQAWSVFANHYHFVVTVEKAGTELATMIRHLHSVTARAVNALDGTPGRQVWFQYWDTHLTHQTSYLARLQYVHLNPVRHGLVDRAADYQWCSASWFEARATESFRKTVESLQVDNLHILDDFGTIPAV